MNKSKEQIKKLENYRQLTENGKYEVILFSAYVILNLNNYSSNDKLKYLKYLKDIRKDYQVKLTGGETVDLINNRMNFIGSEFHQKIYFYSGLYNIFYEDPLTSNPQASSNLIENMKFSIILTQCVNELSRYNNA